MSELANNGIPESGIDERWIPEWVDWGMNQFGSLLRNHALFEKWLEEHPQPTESEEQL